SLASAGSISQTSGNISTGALTGSASGNVTLNGVGNSIASLGNFTAPNLLLADAGSLALAGNISISNLLELAGIAGGVTQSSGTLSAGTLASLGNLAGDVILTDAGNRVGTLGGLSLTANTLDLVDAGTLTIAGPVLANAASLSASAIDLTGSLLSASFLDLTNTNAGGITLAGFASAGTVLSLSSDGNVTETGTLAAATLTGSGVAGSVELTSANNNIGTLGAYSLTGNALGLVDQSALTIAGPVNANSASIATTSSLTLTGSLSTTGNLILSGTSLIALNGFVDAGNVLALQSPGSITETGTVIAADLTSGTITDGSVILTDAFNTIGGIATLASDGSFAAGTLSLLDQVALGVGSLSANDVTLSAPSLNFSGNVAANNVLALASPGAITQSGGTISAGTLTSNGATDGTTNLTQAGNAIANVGSFSASNFDLTDAGLLTVSGPLTTSSNTTLTAGTMILAGALSSANLSLASAGSISQTSGNISTGGLTIAAAGDVGLTSVTNLITNLGSLGGGAGNFSLSDASALTISNNISALNITLASAGLAINGSLQTGNLLISSSGPVTETGVINAATLTTGTGTIAGAVALNGNNTIANLANFAATGNVSLYDTEPLSISGNIVSGSTLGLGDSGNITQTGGLISAAALTSDGGTIGGNVSLDQTGNIIGTLGNFNVAGNLSLVDSTGLSLQGIIDAAGGTLSLYSGGALSQAGGSLVTGLLNASANSITLGDANSIGSLGSVTTGGSLSVNGVSGISGPVTAQTASLIAPGNFTMSGNASITNGLTISAVGNINQTGGTLTAQTAALTTTQLGDSITLSGTDLIAGDLNFTNQGAIIHNAGTLDAGMLTGTGGSLASFGNVTDVGTIGSFIMNDSQFVLNNIGTLNITGPLVANVVSITANGQLILTGSTNGGIFISGNIAPTTVFGPRNGVDSVLQVTGAGPGITQTGSFNINYGPGSALYNTLQYLGTTNLSATIFMITSPSPTGIGSNIQFASAPFGLFAPSVYVVTDAGTYGQITGNINLFNFRVISASQTNLTGKVAGIAGEAAASRASANNPSSRYQLNSCPIGSVNCIVLFIETLPEGNPLGDFDITERRRRRLDKNVQLPGIAMRDF
ncbi:MAG TPA: hypothetical protein PLO16_05650, partial [Acidocella sp.]|nr:hypothetical protein [Acidocella sp.]